MEITPETKVAELLNHYPELEETLVSLAPAFAALRNPVLRRTVAKVTSLHQASKVGNINIVEMVNTLRAKVGQASLKDSFCPDSENRHTPVATHVPQTPVSITIDARPLIERGEHPKEMILASAEQLQSGECMEFIASFTPTPLIELLQKKGYKVTSLAPQDNAVRTYVEKP